MPSPISPVARRRSSPYAAGLSLGELCAIFAIIFIVAAVLFPIFAKAREGRGHGSCASNIKQIGLGFMGYVQDYDDHLPPGAQSLDDGSEKGTLSGWAVTHNTEGEAVLSADTEGKLEAEKPFAQSPLITYIKNHQIFLCPSGPLKPGHLLYMFNDFASGTSVGKIPSQTRTVLLCDGEDFAGNVGHAYDPAALPTPATFSPKGTVVLGATMQNGPKRHNGGANYGFADGHVKWLTPEKVFFPSRFDNSPSHKDAKTGRILGPDPANEKEMAAKGLTATFHLR